MPGSTACRKADADRSFIQLQETIQHRRKWRNVYGKEGEEGRLALLFVQDHPAQIAELKRTPIPDSDCWRRLPGTAVRVSPNVGKNRRA